MALFLDLEPGEAVAFGDTVVRLETKSGKRARLRIDSPADVKHLRLGETAPAPAALQRKPAAPETETAPAPAGPNKPLFTRRTAAG